MQLGGLLKRYSVALKARGFDLEQTPLRHLDRLEKLFFVLALMFGWYFKLGIWQHELKPISIKKHGRKSKSLFRYGADYLHQVLLETDDKIRQFMLLLKVLSCT